MIKRSYFMVFRKNFHDGTNNYAENSFTIHLKSWIGNPGAVMDAGQENAEAKLSECPGDVVFCTTFNRL